MSSQIGLDGRRAATASLTQQSTPSVVRWAWVGAVILAFMVCVLGRWFWVGNAVPTPPGVDPLPETSRQVIQWVQWIAMLLGTAALLGFVVVPWRREGHLTTTGMLFLCWLTLFFQDPMMNYTSTSVLYNSYMVNLGTWTLGSTPGWLSPRGNLLPEPLLLIIVGYTIIGYSLCFPVLKVLGKIQERRPRITRFQLAVLGVLILIALDTAFESLLLRTGVYAYPAGIRTITLFAGNTYQFPLSEAVCYGGLTIGATLLLLLYRDAAGHTFVERGVDRVRLSPSVRQWVKFLALFGYVHLSMFVVFTVPMQWFALHSDPFPAGYPSYMINGLCAYGPKSDQCPGPETRTARP